MAVYDIHFEADKAEIKSDSKQALTNIADFLKSHSDRHFIIVGHAAGVGDFEAGMELSEKRAKAVLNELITKNGVDKDQLKSYGVDALCPLASNATDDGKAKNRRVEIVVQ
ncbi:MAG TPA: OmpA family protein [bacterium]|nr:OmpA family protein [bacterium]